MDVSLVAAVGSFVVSERVLKPKATALFILGCVLAYDLTTKTHDPVSLRVYRGPAMLAYTLMLCALSLRIWRRNGVACDELLFLPGTQHGQNHGIDAPLVESPSSPVAMTSPMVSPLVSPSGQRQRQQISLPLVPLPLHALEADAAAGGGRATHTTEAAPTTNGNAKKPSRKDSKHVRHRRSNSDDIELANLAREVQQSASIGNIPNNNADLSISSSSSDAARLQQQQRQQSEDEGLEDERIEMVHSGSSHGTATTVGGHNSHHATTVISRTASHLDTDEDSQATDGLLMDSQNQPNVIQRFQANHPQITQIGNFFFFRSSSTSTQSAAYAPSGPSVFGAALDMSMPILFNFHLFIEAYNQRSSEGEATAKILPLIFLSVLIVRTSVPPSRRGRFWSTLKFTFTAPLHRVRVRDACIGDVLTSLVRPCQDLFFALAYYVTVIYGTASGDYGLDRSEQLLEGSWLLHNIILPTCAILPLWWKYLQTLRQAYDANKRWPHQANSLKYLLSTLVIIYGMTHPEDRRSPWWIVCFCLTVMYQIWWDVVMDWDLFTIQREVTLIDSGQESWFENISSIRPNSTILLALHMYMLQPVLGLLQRLRIQIPHWRQIKLREKRLYKTESFYWKIFFFNMIMRFTWMLCFIPAYHFSRSRKYVTASTDTNSYFGVLLPVAELFRRTCWGFLFLEKETLRMMDSDSMYSRVEADDASDEEDDEDDNSKLEIKSFRMLPTWLDVQQQVAHEAATTGTRERDVFMRKLFAGELVVWAGAFVGLGCWMAS